MFSYRLSEEEVSYLIDLLNKEGTEKSEQIQVSLTNQMRSWHRWEKEMYRQEIFTGI
jgi:hypothetical protein